MLGVNRVIILKLIALVGWSLVCYFLLPLKVCLLVQLKITVFNIFCYCCAIKFSHSFKKKKLA